MRRTHSCLIVLAICACLAACDRTTSNKEIVTNVRAVIEAQQAAWNRGDIDGFMDGYDRSEATTFVSGDDLTRGWQTVLDRYKKSYTSRALMGTLTFSDLDIKPIGPTLAIVDGRWKLKRADDAPHGRFTLFFSRINNNWRITHDTTTLLNP